MCLRPELAVADRNGKTDNSSGALKQGDEMKTPIVHPTKVMQALGRAGFRKIRSKGDHIIFARDERRVIVCFRTKGKEIPAGSMKRILRDAGLTTEQFSEYLKK